MNFVYKKNKRGFSQVVDFGFVFENTSKKLKSLFGKFMLGVGIKFNKSKTFSKPKFTTGFSLVEVLLYIAIVTVVMLAVINIVLIVSKSIKKAEVYNSIKNSAISGLEKITKEVRFATGIDLDNSIFNSSNGILVLNTLDESGSPEVTRFYSNNGLIKTDINGIYFRTITYSDTKVSDLVFIPIITDNSQSIKIEMTMSGGEENSLISEKFYSTIVLRNSYLK